MLAEFFAVVKGNGMPAVLRQRKKQVHDFFPSLIGPSAGKLAGQEIAALAIDERHEHALFPAAADDGVPLEIPQPLPVVDDLRTSINLHTPGNSANFRRVAALPASPQVRFPVLAVGIALGPCVNGLRRYMPLGLVRMLPLEASGNLVRRPLQRESLADGCIQLGPLQLAHQGTIPPPRGRLLLGMSRKVSAIRPT